MKNSKGNIIGNVFLLIVSGLCLGWMTGMSVSPVIGTVVGTILTLLISVASILAGITPTTEQEGGSEKKIIQQLSIVSRKISLVPIAVLIMSLTGGGAIGIWCRTHDFLGKKNECVQTPSNLTAKVSAEELREWVQLYTSYGLDSTYIAEKVFNFQLGIIVKAEEIKPIELAGVQETNVKHSEGSTTGKNIHEFGGFFSERTNKADGITLCHLDSIYMRNKIETWVNEKDKRWEGLLKLSGKELLDYVEKHFCNY